MATPCCFLLFLPLVVISTSISLVDASLGLNMHACVCADMHQMGRIPPAAPPAVSIAGFVDKRECSFQLIQAVAAAELG